MANNSGQTGSDAASAAAKTLADPTSTPKEKSAAASALSQAPESEGETGAKAASASSKTLSDSKSAGAEKSAAASALSQTPTDADKDAKKK
ncbi:hypothetical protein [Streptosporangium lutulentum]|uniref:Uncharacterized protein n=1 Tax=Streptosporangium lutulentum TaxID=1461250 RepID=A0ABT9Q2B4_9ACTN|nr:hypothetical protein [Streptosporangium lutulentum]MDP9840868.1 hypothetical protein [Streptosporangium lutulentum]